MGTLALIVVPFAVLALITAFVLTTRLRTGGDEDALTFPGRRWFGRPATWALVSVALVVLGLFVAPRLFGFLFLFLPFLWIRGQRRRGPRGRDEA